MDIVKAVYEKFLTFETWGMQYLKMISFRKSK